MLPKPLTRDELQSGITQLEQALYNHLQWYNFTIRSLVCHLTPDRHDILANAHKNCRFGQWYYNDASENLRHNPGFIALGKEHLEMHKMASKLLLTIKNGQTISLTDYDNFANALEKLRLELSVLQKELIDLLYNSDTLTGAINRLNMLPVLREQHALVKRNIQTCFISMLDFDKFKTINDVYGHAAGDIALSTVSEYIIANIRPYDKFFRIGGEEFLISFPDTNRDLAYKMIERLRVGISELVIAIGKDKCINITASFGIAPIEATISIEESIEHADQMLYKVKKRGGNGVECWVLT